MSCFLVPVPVPITEEEIVVFSVRFVDEDEAEDDGEQK
jgi:hypothetical protein